ncbi:hypothetical protein ACH5RR_013081 [Cinchona calisaya]|uniref:Transposase n=1 Tax=Cinchona calisaya TaxID=153742 RepID=A0ABD2ZZ45_9GENT
MVPTKATGENLVNTTINSLLEWNLDKIFTATMDNHLAHDAVARCLQEHYLSRGLLLLSGKSAQFRCWGHILNLIVQEGLDEIKACIQRIQNAVKYVKASPKRKLEFLQYADQERIPKGYEITCNSEVLKNEKFINNETSNSNAPFGTKINTMADFYMHDDEEDCIYGKTELDTYLEKKIHPSRPDEYDDFNN